MEAPLEQRIIDGVLKIIGGLNRLTKGTEAQDARNFEPQLSPWRCLHRRRLLFQPPKTTARMMRPDKNVKRPAMTRAPKKRPSIERRCCSTA